MLQELSIIALRGIGLGAMYALLAMSFNVVYSSSRILNFAQGNLFALGGLVAALLLQGSTLAARRRLLPVGFLLNWLAFIGFTALFSTLFWAMQCLLTLSLLTPIPLGVQILTCAGAYPALAALFIRAHRGAAAAELA